MMKRTLLTIIIIFVSAFLCPAFAEGNTDTPQITSTEAFLHAVGISWSCDTDDDVTIRYATDSSFSANRKTVTADGSKTSKKITGLDPSKTYFFMIKAGTSWSDPVKVTTLTYDQRAEQILGTMSLKQKAAQMLMVRKPEKNALKQVKNNHYGGYVLFADDLKGKSKKSVRKMIRSYQNASLIGMFIATDEEGGTVVRVSSNPKLRKHRFMSPRKLKSLGGLKRVGKDTRTKSKLLMSLGINTNLAPVADVTYRRSDFMYKRTYSNKARSVSSYIKVVIREMNDYNMISCLKHFPGYGGNGDTHATVIRDKRSLKTFRNRDLLPFKAGIRSGCSMIMVSHNIVKCMDKKRPASLSRKVHRYMRDELGFDGVIISDDLVMKGVRKFGDGTGDLAVKAVKAGNDMIITDRGYTCKTAIVKAVRSGEISEDDVDASVKRILKLKLKKGIIQ